MAESNSVERSIERLLFASRWLLAPIYLGLVLALGMLLVVFIKELVHYLPHTLEMTEKDLILFILSLIDLALIGNLMVIVIFSGYESFVSKLDIANEADRPSWMGSVDFSGIKIKLIASVVAISAIQLLKHFMKIHSNEADLVRAAHDLKWLVTLHLTFVFSGVMMALMDWLKSRSK
ncbi:MAG TPA: hypothetical protein DD729_07995 [Rhodobacteraceae bacterium]|jgi:uncharacterized protein (TIGR00645 family)|nr:hypothetical protein [Paracoccaceae bacterium]